MIHLDKIDFSCHTRNIPSNFCVSTLAARWRQIPKVNNEFQTLADTLYWEKIERARRMKPEDRMLAGTELFDYACNITLTALREQMPGKSEAELLAALRQRLAIKRQLEEATR
jgi:hypothetical protein